MRRLRTFFVQSLALVLGTVVLGGCAGQVFAPKGGMLFYPPEFPAADRAVKAAEASGKATQCPDAFREAARLRDEAYNVYWSCRLAESLDLARKAEAQANALCPVAKAPAPPPTPAPPPAPAPVAPPPPAPTARITADPASVQRGQCTTLRWSSENATGASIEPGLGSVAPSGTQQVCPSSTTQYRIAATGAGGSATASTSVSVTAPPPPPPAPAPAPVAPPAPKVVDRLTLHVNFDTDKAVIRPADVPELQKAIDFLKKYPGHKVSIEGHTDSRGTEAYNQRLSERRANSVRDYLVKRGAADASRMSTVGHGEVKPIADNATAKGRFQNRRVEVLILSE